MKRNLKLVAFDLDGTVWLPEMYQLSGGSPFQEVTTTNETTQHINSHLLDAHGTKLEMLGVVHHILHELKTHDRFNDVLVAWVSCTDEPRWAKECLNKLKTIGGDTIASCADHSEIFIANKQQHFQNIQQQYPTIAYDEMLFFDNEMRNIKNVSVLGVQCVHCPDGMTEDVWQQGLSLFSLSSSSS